MTNNEIPATTESFNVKVRVSDLIMTKTGDFNDSTILDIQIRVHGKYLYIWVCSYNRDSN